MAGNSRFDISAAGSEGLSLKGTFPNGQRGSLMSASLDRSGSFREGNDGRMFSSGAGLFRRNPASPGDLPPLSQYLVLDPITMGDQKYTRSGELRRVLGISFGSASEDCPFGAANLKPPPPVATEELKRFKASVLESSVKARGRSKRLDESLHKLNKYCDALNLKKQHRNEILMNERLGGSNLSKMGNQTCRSPSELMNQKLEDRHKNIILNKRVRTSIAEIRAEGQSNNSMRQGLVIGKDRDTLRDGGECCDFVEEKMRLPAGAETWDRKMKRKRSMGSVFARSVDGEGEMKRVMHLKLNNESGLQSSEVQGLRSGSSGSNSKLDVTSLSASSNTCTTAKNELDKVSRDLTDGSNKEIVLKGNKFNVRDNSSVGGAYTLSKGKASRAQRAGPLMDGKPSVVPRSSGMLEVWEQPSSANRPNAVFGTSNRKRPLSTVSSPTSMAQWVGQRPQKISRTRRANVVSPILNCDEVQMSSEGCSPSDDGTKMTSSVTSGSVPAKVVVNSIQQGRVKYENISSPARLFESEKSVVGESGESKLKEKGLGSGEFDKRSLCDSPNISTSASATKKNKISNKEEIGDGLRRQGRSSRGSSTLRTSISPVKEKLEATTLTKLQRSMKPASEKNGSKSGRPPLKKSSDRKATARLGHPSTDSPDIAGDSDDDREELLAAANFASSASYSGCSSTFWKKLEPVLAPVNLEDIARLKQLVKSVEEDYTYLSEMVAPRSDTLDGLQHKNSLLSQSPISTEIQRSILGQIDSKEISSVLDMIDQHNISFLGRKIDSPTNKVAPLYQRVLAALIEDTNDEEPVRETNFLSCERDGSLAMACFTQAVEHKSRVRTEFESTTLSSSQAKNHCASDTFSCNGNATLTNGLNIHDQVLDDLLSKRQGPLHSENETFPMLAENVSGILLGVHTDPSCLPSLNCHYEKMSLEDKLLLELQSVGVFPEAVPDLADGDSEAIDQEIIELQRGLHQQVCKKREYVMKLIQPVEERREMEQRTLEQVAMDKLIESAYKKKLATRGSSAARYGLPKISKQVAMAFMKRSFARCRKFEETGRSCFMEPLFKDVLFATPTHDNCAGSAVTVHLPQTQNSEQGSPLTGFIPCREQYGLQSGKSGSNPVEMFGNLNHPSDQEFARTGPIVNRGKKKELLLDDVGGGAYSRSASTIGNSFMGGAKGKRSERERDKDTSGRNSITKASRPSAGYSRGERRTKAKPKQKTAQLSASGNGSLSKLTDTTNSEHQLATGSGEVIANGGNRNSNVEPMSKEADETIDFTNLHELDSIELGVANEDLGSWLNIDEDGLQDHDAVGLDIPMDDLSELTMLL
ncbi:hypothetical protein L6164_008655 [Bauhinia variegata]|uniref:Uncharacterized protein n=2 Tax=Bauhinia variegata TaxID=167791 RepID=A0ACB9PH57_BAUVA|nr:hypothetical protein L6164_008655 [Bauhinia variegata]